MTTGERLVSISTLPTETAMNHFLNIETGGETVIRVFGKYTVKYIPSPKVVIRYLPSPKMIIKYIKPDTLTIKYIKPKPVVIRYIPSPTIKITYQCKQ